LAKSVATECKSAFIWLSSWELYTKWCDRNGNRIQSLFKLARERQPCILLLDDIDGVFGQRNDLEWEPFRKPIVEEFLTQMEGMLCI
jgi:proteasome regulatory subunit